jgi:hypothetical protein
MFAILALTYALMGAMISWASPAPAQTSDALNPTDPSTDSAVPPTPDLGINCRGSLLCDLGSGGESSQLVGFIREIADDAWYDTGQQIGGNLFFFFFFFFLLLHGGHLILIVFSVMNSLHVP